MSSPVQIVQSVYAAFGRREMAQAFALLSPDLVILQSEALPWGGTYRGHEGARQFFTKLLTNLNSTLEFERFIDAGDHVIAVGWTQGKVVSTGASYRVPIAHVWKIANGLVVEVRFFIDNPTMLAALGAGGR